MVLETVTAVLQRLWTSFATRTLPVVFFSGFGKLRRNSKSKKGTTTTLLLSKNARKMAILYRTRSLQRRNARRRESSSSKGLEVVQLRERFPSSFCASCRVKGFGMLRLLRPGRELPQPELAKSGWEAFCPEKSEHWPVTCFCFQSYTIAVNGRPLQQSGILIIGITVNMGKPHPLNEWNGVKFLRLPHVPANGLPVTMG